MEKTGFKNTAKPKSKDFLLQENNMESLTKHKLTKETISKMVEKFFKPFKMTDCQELTEGYFNMAYEICLNNGKRAILKIAPLKEMRIMTYEKNIMLSEVEAMKMAKKTGEIPVPDLIGYDDSCTICNSPYFFMEKIDGRSLNMEKNSLSADQIADIYIEVGKINRKINEINCPCFGYPGQPAFQGNEWFPVFQKMLENGIQDAENSNVDLKIPINTLRAFLKKDKNIFDEVTEPKLVHWDCWDGNIFVKDGKVTGIIDWERCLWADPLMEVNFRTYDDNKWFRKGYGLEELSDSEYRRALWYDIYLMIIMSSEYEYRKYETMDSYIWATGLLQEQFGKL